MAVKDGLPSTDFSRMNREYIKAVAEGGSGGGVPAVTDLPQLLMDEDFTYYTGESVQNIINNTPIMFYIGGEIIFILSRYIDGPDGFIEYNHTSPDSGGPTLSTIKIVEEDYIETTDLYPNGEGGYITEAIKYIYDSESGNYVYSDNEG